MTTTQLDLEILLLRNAVEKQCSQQQSLSDLVDELRQVAESLGLDFGTVILQLPIDVIADQPVSMAVTGTFVLPGPSRMIKGTIQ